MKPLDEAKIEKLLRARPELADFWRSPAPLLLIRSRPSRADPVYEIQLAFDLGDRLETWRWLWVDALEGRVIRQFPP
ncbi:MAG: hypothetical protein IT573_03815 [Deltaproteobacteria bacterium]|nr:hypothetical protein [Deltaproteobacteria bacterium]